MSNNNHYAFISYAHADSDIVKPIIDKLSLNYIVWFDEGIPSTSQYDDVIASKISKATCFIAFLSKNYDASMYCRDEIIYAKEEYIPILPVFLENSPLSGSLKMKFGHIQGIGGSLDIMADTLASEPILRSCSKESNSWGPLRTTFTLPSVTFNSVTNNPQIGDERNFVRVREYGTGNPHQDSVDIEVGKEYEIWVYYHNCADQIFNSSSAGIAENVQLSALIPQKLTNMQAAVVKCQIFSSNAHPNKVWDTAYLRNNNGTVWLRYVPNSAIIHNGGSANGTILDSESFFDPKRGAKLAYDKTAWGVIPGGYEYAGYVTFRIKVDKPSFRITTTIAHEGRSDYAKELDAQPGDVIKVRIRYDNTGTVDQRRVCMYISSITSLNETDIKRPVDKSVGELLIPNSTVATVPNSPSPVRVTDILAKRPLNVGDYHSGESCTVDCKIKVPPMSGALYVRTSIATANGTGFQNAIVHVA